MESLIECNSKSMNANCLIFGSETLFDAFGVRVEVINISIKLRLRSCNSLITRSAVKLIPISKRLVHVILPPFRTLLLLHSANCFGANFYGRLRNIVRKAQCDIAIMYATYMDIKVMM